MRRLTTPRRSTRRAGAPAIRGGPGGQLLVAYGDPMRYIEKQSRQDVILGHRLEVTTSDDRWAIAVDGREIATKLDEAYDAWAVGVAESYRQGQVASGRALDD